MSSGWPMVPLGEVLTRVDDTVPVIAEQTYREVTVRLWGKGVTLRRECRGVEIKSDRRTRVRAGQFIVSRIDARNGAFGVIPPDLDGAVVTGEFPTFASNPDRLDARFLEWMSKTAAFVDLCRAASEGTTNRVRLKEDRFLATPLPLPPIGEQRRIVARIDALAAKIAEARGLRAATAAEVQIALDAARRSIFPPANGTAVRDYATVQSGYAFKSEWFTADGIRLVRNVNIGHGRVQWEQVARIPTQRRAEFDRFELYDGDILITLDRPIISTGVKVARVHEADLPSLLLQRVGRLQFKNGHVLPDYLFAWLQSPAFADAIDPGRSNGVPHISPKDVEQIPFTPPSPAEQSKIVAHLDKLQTILETAKRLHRETAAELSALLPSVLSRAFRGEL